MKVSFRESFARDLEAIRSEKTKQRVREIIQCVEQANTLRDIPNLKSLEGMRKYFRIRIGDMRIGIAIESSVVIFVRCLNRKDIYRYFP